MDGPITSVYTVALPEEAAPIIEELELQRETGACSQPVYIGQDVALIVSGIGKVKAAAATARLFSFGVVSPHATAINFGIAGGVFPDKTPLGALFLVNRIVDAGSRREFYPDMIVEARIPETTVTTFDVPVTGQSDNIPEFGLVDMEAAGFFETATLFTGPHHIACLKVVSDHLEGKRLDRREIRGLVENHAGPVISLAREMVSLQCGAESSHTDTENEWIATVSSALRLTVSQTHILRDWVIAHRISSRGPLPALTEELSRPVKTKTERNRRFETIRKRLAP